jgi:hypothetical protein
MLAFEAFAYEAGFFFYKFTHISQLSELFVSFKIFNSSINESETIALSIFMVIEIKTRRRWWWDHFIDTIHE